MNTNQAVKRFGKAVQQIRKDNDMTLEELALEIGIDSAHLSRIERGQKNITLATAAKIAVALGLDLKFGKYRLTSGR